MSVKVCEHGHLRRVCDVCELQAEVTRLREVCRLAAIQLDMVTINMPQGGRAQAHTLGVIADLEQAGKEATDGQ